MALTFSNAVTVAQMELNKIQRFSNSYALLPEYATETPYGWLIPWAQSNFRVTKEVTMSGNAPFFVDRFTGGISQVGACGSFEEWIKTYCRERGYEIDAA